VSRCECRARTGERAAGHVGAASRGGCGASTPPPRGRAGGGKRQAGRPHTRRRRPRQPSSDKPSLCLLGVTAQEARRAARTPTNRARAGRRERARTERARAGGRLADHKNACGRQNGASDEVSPSVSASEVGARRSDEPPKSDQAKARPGPQFPTWVYLCALLMDFLLHWLFRGPREPSAPAGAPHSCLVALVSLRPSAHFPLWL